MNRLTSVFYIPIIVCGIAGCGSRSFSDTADKNSHDAMLSSGISEPQNADEAEILNFVSSLEDGGKKSVGAISVEVKKTYHAASGRLCKAAILVGTDSSASAKHVTVCRVDGAWAYMPEVVHVPFAQGPDQ